MNPIEKRKLLKWNTILWLLAMIAPAALSLSLAGTKFPWPMILPFLLLGCLLASNKMLLRALEAADGAP
ncbi:hypothetical protein OJ996_23515 [Luteolibacter sp. GHJ8]|uniref:Uncharacterized protein n=1 Tax=Luteolibacter rhizosphaerae TaxID=2989719 RepID=A0ABT3GAP5_9BACT|nr:hypothetical protein [Luteolibacter rhizosphaerae]MCW1916576.1 hypothetical protein [Luteolibacter rhizosphaerae]